MTAEKLMKSINNFGALVREISPIDDIRVAVNNVLDSIEKPEIAKRIDRRFRLYYLIHDIRKDSKTVVEFIAKLKEKEKLNQIAIDDNELATQIGAIKLEDKEEIEILQMLDTIFSQNVENIIKSTRYSPNYVERSLSYLKDKGSEKLERSVENIVNLLQLIRTVISLLELLGKDVSVNEAYNDLKGNIDGLDKKAKSKLNRRLNKLKEVITEEAEIYFLENSIKEINSWSIDPRTIAKYPRMIENLIEGCKKFKDKALAEDLAGSDIINYVRFYVNKLKFIYNIKLTIEKGKREGDWKDFLKFVKMSNIGKQRDILIKDLRDKPLGDKLLAIREKWGELPGYVVEGPTGMRGEGWDYEISLIYNSLYNENNRTYVAEHAKKVLIDLLNKKTLELTKTVREVFIGFMVEVIYVIKKVIGDRIKFVESSIRKYAQDIINFVRKKKAMADSTWKAIKSKFLKEEEKLKPARELLDVIQKLEAIKEDPSPMVDEMIKELNKVNSMANIKAPRFGSVQDVLHFVKRYGHADSAAMYVTLIQKMLDELYLAEIDKVLDKALRNAEAKDLKKRYSEFYGILSRMGLDKIAYLGQRGGVNA